MTSPNGAVDKNLSNVVDELEATPVNSHHAQQLQQQTNDRRHQDALNHDKPSNNSHGISTKGESNE